MILADKIIQLRKKNGWSQEELAERLDVSRQSVSKWESGLSIPDMNKILGMSALFGVSTDYLLKDELEEITPSETPKTDDPGKRRTVEPEEANRYLEAVQRYSPRIALGVMLCILSPICLILLGGWTDCGLLALSEGAAIGIGMTVLFLTVAGAVALFILNGTQLSEFAYLDRESFTLGYGVKGIVEKKRDEFRPRFISLLTVSVILCILSVLPLIILGALEFSDGALIGCTGLLLGICSVAVAIIVRISYRYGSYERLLQIGEFTEEQKQQERQNAPIDTVYWSLVTAIYLGVSFWTMDWHITWIIWVIAGCLDPLVHLIARNLQKK